jgi:hypothetical protein
MSDNFKDTLMQALHTSAKYFNAGLTPDESVAKTAQELNFNLDQTHRLVETFNTARTIFHYKTAADRSATFPLSDKDAVTQLMFNEPAKAKAASTQDYSVYKARELDYTGDTVLGRDGLQIMKAAEQSVQFDDTNLETQSQKAMQLIHIQRDLAETARGEANTWACKAGQLLSKLARDLSVGYIENCVDRYSRLKIACKDYPAINKLAECMPKHIQAQPIQGLVDDRDLTSYAAILKEAGDTMLVESEMLAISDQLNKEASAFEREFMELLSLILPQKKAESLGDLVSPDFFKSAQRAKEQAPSAPSSKKGPDVVDALSGAAMSKGIPSLVSSIPSALIGDQTKENKQL